MDNGMTQKGRATRVGVASRLERLTEAIESGGEFFNPFVTARAREELRQADRRLAAGEGITVAALMGGTGSGKSSLFNLLTGLQFAEVSDLRPTTREPSACTWNVDASELLDMLRIPHARRIAHESMLVDDDGTLDSLVLIDMPDHDSVALENVMWLDRLLPMVDILVWVVDPQKYADQLLHEGYLAALRARRDQTIVVVNQIDTLPAGTVEILCDDVRRLLLRDGLEGVPVIPVSVGERTGIESVRERLVAAVAQTDSAMRSAESELDAIRQRLAKELGAGEAELSGAPVAELVSHIEDAVALDAVVESIEESGKSLRAVALAKPEQPAASMMNAVRDSWLGHARTGLPPAWQQRVEKEVPPSDKIRRAVSAALRGIPVTPAPRRPRLILLVVGVLAVVVGIGVAVLLAVNDAGAGSAILAMVCALAVGAVCLAWGKHSQKNAARQRAQEYRDGAHGAVEELVQEMMVEPAARVVNRHRATRIALAPVSEDLS